MLGEQKSKLPFFLYAYCLMTNHIHLLIERMTDDVGRVMHRLLTGYSQYYNRKYRRTGHLFQGRHRAILCQSDAYLAELVRYIHLNPIRAKMVELPQDYPFSSHRAYMGLDAAGPVDVDPVLRHFGPKKAVSRERFAAHVAEGVGMGHLAHLYQTESGVLGNENFVDRMVHRIGEFKPKGTPRASNTKELSMDDLVKAIVIVFEVAREDFCGKAKGAKIMAAKETLILAGRRLGATTTSLSNLTGLSISNVSRRHQAGLCKLKDDPDFLTAYSKVVGLYHEHVNTESTTQQA